MDQVVLIVAIAVGIPVILDYAQKLYRDSLKARELAIQERKLQMEEKLRSDELNAKILRMDDLGVSPEEIASLASEVRQLRQEVVQMRQELNGRIER